MEAKHLSLNTNIRTKVLICAPDNFISTLIENFGRISCSVLLTVRNLGVTFDQALSFDKNVGCIV